MGTIIKEVAFLDLTEANEETLKEIKAIQNVALILYNEKFEPFMSKVSFHNIASSVKVPGNFTLINGKLELDKSFATGIKEPMFFLVNGSMIVKSDVTADMIEQAISGLFINGKIYCPERTQASLQQKISQNNGKVIAYIDDARLETGKLTINNDYLRQLKSKTNLAVIGKVKMVEDLDPSLFDEKLNKIQFLKGAVVSDVIQEILSGKLVNDTSKIITVPNGYTYIDGNLQLGSDEITTYQQAKLFVTGSVYLDEDVSEEDVKNHIATIKTEEAIYCPTKLKTEILQVCDPSTKVITYSGTLRVIDGEYKLTQAELNYTENNMTYIVQGVLQIDKNVDPKALYEKVERVDLYGVVSGSTEQCGVLQTKLKVNKGVVDHEDDNGDDKPIESENPDDTYIANVSLLKL